MCDLVGCFEGEDLGFVIFKIDLLYHVVDRREQDLLLLGGEEDIS